MQSSPLLSLSPSFDRYSNSRLADIAARVVEEFEAEKAAEGDAEAEYDANRVFGYEDSGNYVEAEEFAVNEVRKESENREKDDDDDDDDGGGGDDDEEFEFAVVDRDFQSSPISADEIFYNGQIRPVYPLFDRTLLLGDGEVEAARANSDVNSRSSKPPVAPTTTVRLSLKKLFIEEREATSSCSSSEADDLEALAPGTYCVWVPKTAATSESSSPGRCKKSNSTGSSKRWKFRDLLHRSHSDGKDTFVFLTPSKKRDSKTETEEKPAMKVSKDSAKVKTTRVAAGDESTVTATRYGKIENDRRLSYLPYRQDLVGLFANMNGFSRNLHPF